MTYGSVETVREILDIESGEEEEKIQKCIRLANTWVTLYVDSDTLSQMDTGGLDAATNFFAIYLFRLSSERFSGQDTAFATRWRDDAEDVLKRSMSRGVDIYRVKKVNDETSEE